MEVASTKPGLQVYDGAQLGVADPATGRSFGPGAGICLETQSFPDSPNRPDFPDTTLRPGRTYRHRTEFRFSARPPSASR
jgi:aldose 1-epimerase